MKDPATAEETRKEIERLFKERIERESMPKDIWVIDDMPHHGMGKIDYAKLAMDYEALMSTGSQSAG